MPDIPHALIGYYREMSRLSREAGLHDHADICERAAAQYEKHGLRAAYEVIGDA